jgi:hypothetical protein
MRLEKPVLRNDYHADLALSTEGADHVNDNRSSLPSNLPTMRLSDDVISPVVEEYFIDCNYMAIKNINLIDNARGRNLDHRFKKTQS